MHNSISGDINSPFIYSETADTLDECPYCGARHGESAKYRCVQCQRVVCERQTLSIGTDARGHFTDSYNPGTFCGYAFACTTTFGHLA